MNTTSIIIDKERQPPWASPGAVVFSRNDEIVGPGGQQDWWQLCQYGWPLHLGGSSAIILLDKLEFDADMCACIKKNADLEKGDFNMKKILCALLVGILLVGLAACSKSPTAPQSVDNPNATNSSPVITPIGKGETGISEVPTEDPIESISQLLSYSIYVPNDNANGFVVETVSTADISAETVLTELKKRNVLPEAVSVNNFHMDNGLITIDFNQAFADVVCSMGTSGEMMVVGSVVNTFLDAFQAESVYFTVDGQILESGHVIYDFAMPFFSVDPQSANELPQ